MNIDQFGKYIVEPTLKELGLYSLEAVQLLVATALTESGLQYVKQLKGPALGLFQMEPETHDDIWGNYITYRNDLADKVSEIDMNCTANNMIWNLKYATVMARIHYLRVREPLPKMNDIDGMGRYWKKYYNTEEGKGEEEHFITKSSVIFN